MSRLIYKELMDMMEQGNDKVYAVMEEEGISPEELQYEIEQVKCKGCQGKIRGCSYHCAFTDFMNTDFDN